MKHAIAVFSLALGIGIGFTPHASAQQDTVVVNVPFDFAIAGKLLPQGEYRIATDGGFISVRDSELKPHRFLRGVPGDPSKDGRTALVFDNVDGNYFLRKIVTTDGGMNMEFNESKLERKTKTSENSRSIYADNSGR